MHDGKPPDGSEEPVGIDRGHGRRPLDVAGTQVRSHGCSLPAADRRDRGGSRCPGVRFSTPTRLDLHPLYADRPDEIGRLLRTIVADVEHGELEPLPFRAFDLAAAEPALRHMTQARHIGKVVPTAREAAYDVPGAQPGWLLRADGAYVVTGGLGGFGLEIARWLAAEGAGHIVLASRRGLPRDDELGALEESPRRPSAARSAFHPRGRHGATGGGIELYRGLGLRVSVLGPARPHWGHGERRSRSRAGPRASRS